MRPGGNIPNTLTVLGQGRRIDDRLVFLSAIADKTVSRKLTEPLEKRGVEVIGKWRDSTANPQSWILRSEQTGSRTIVNYNEYGPHAMVNIAYKS
jgi:sugar/nucleoside kinase (ribokinase family)